MKEDAAREVVDSITAAGGRALAVPADVSDAAQVDAMFTLVQATFGYVDVLYNNAGLIDSARHFLKADETWWDRIIQVNLKSVFLCSHRAARIMARRRKGVIIGNISTVGASLAL